MSKICSDCKEEKELSLFANNKRTKDGKNGICKQCMINRAKEYRKTLKGVVNTIYNSMKQHSKERGQVVPGFSFDGLYGFLKNNIQFINLYNDWKNNSYNRWMKPSCDRKDESIGYTFDNIEIMRWKENSDKGRDDSNKRRMKGVVKMDLNGNDLHKYDSLADACRENDISSRSNLRTHIRNNTLHCVGFKWRYS